ncbi:MAG: SDR family oxidoreductase [Inhella sp.]|jgi:NAD(P)H dehydrogenase (quinone)|uniref:SDR family oxidoreductase n=1 Tax=Inhella sp. TaxID=1921806 RepID=UPI0022C04DD6|nr:SDR family oxidoreductase [Inhella sp.]MCZ8235363.1 SDR family oxidoreductase [Inhella sp.]
MSNRILVTGASGNIGRALVAALGARGADFQVMSSRPGTAPAGLREVQGDFTQLDSLQAAFAGVDTLFLLLPLVPGIEEMARNAVDAAKAAGVKHIVRSSGAGADAHSPASLARVHGEIDDRVMASGIPFTLLRPSSFMQNHLNFYAGSIQAASAVYAPRGEGAVGLIDVRDIAEVAALVLADPAAHVGAVYTLTGGEALTDAQSVAAISRAVGREIRYVDVPEAAAVEAMTQMGFAPTLIDWLMSLNHVIKQGWAAGLSDDVKRLTGHAPRTFDAFAREHAAAWR